VKRSSTCREIDADPTPAADNEETAKLPSLSAAANDEIATAAIDDICARLDELISLGRSINDHLEYLVNKQNLAD
jgi:hypothetical protein